jgi:TolB protein
VHVIGADGAERSLVVANALGPTWAPDGRSLAFSSYREGNWDIYRLDRDSGVITRLTSDPAKDQHPSWSPAGDRIAFSSDRAGNEEIYLMSSADGSEVTRLTRNMAKEFNPCWSPDGENLVFYRAKGDGKDQIHVVSADGSGEWSITQNAANNVFPSFLPDGRIAFSSQRKGREELVTVGPGGWMRRVAGVEASFARWSPDGGQVAFIAGEWPVSAVYVMNADGSAVRKIVN